MRVSTQRELAPIFGHIVHRCSSIAFFHYHTFFWLVFFALRQWTFLMHYRQSEAMRTAKPQLSTHPPTVSRKPRSGQISIFQQRNFQSSFTCWCEGAEDTQLFWLKAPVSLICFDQSHTSKYTHDIDILWFGLPCIWKHTGALGGKRDERDAAADSTIGFGKYSSNFANDWRKRQRQY